MQLAPASARRDEAQWSRSSSAPGTQSASRRARRTIRAIRWSCASAPTSRSSSMPASTLSPFQIAYKTYGTLNAAAQQRGADLPRAHRRPARRQRPSGDRQARLVGNHGRARQADRHRALFRHLPERGRRLHGHDRAGLDQSADRQALGPRLSGHHHPRHGARAGDAARPSRHRARCSRSPAARWAACRCCNGRRAIRERVFAALPIACATRHSAQNIAFHEVGRQAVMADPEWRQRPLSDRGHQSAPRPRGRAHGRAHHLPVGRRAASQVRPQVPGPRQSDVLVRRRFRGGDPICAIRAVTFVERFDANSLSLSHPRDGLFRPRGRL